LRSLIALIAASAVTMWVFRAMLVGDFFWAKCIGVALVTVFGCFIAYAGLFLLAQLFAVVTSPIVTAFDSASTEKPDSLHSSAAHDRDQGAGASG